MPEPAVRMLLRGHALTERRSGPEAGAASRIAPASRSAIDGPCLNPWPEPPPTSQTFGCAGCGAAMKCVSRRDLVPGRARRDERRVLEGGEAVVRYARTTGSVVGFVRELRVGVDWRPLVVDRRLDAQRVDVRGAVSGAVVVTPARHTGRAPGRAAVEEQQLLAGDRELDEITGTGAQARPARPDDDVALESRGVFEHRGCAVRPRAARTIRAPCAAACAASVRTARSRAQYAPSGSSSTKARSSPRKLG